MKEEKNSVFDNYKRMFKEALNDLKTKGKRYKQIPNILTILRLTAPFFIIPAAFSGNIPLAVGLTAGFGLTDFVDGFIARKFNLTSELGKDLDAVCDKVFAGTLLIAASFANHILLTNLALEGVIASVNVYKTIKGEEVHSTFVGKAKTWALFGLAGLGLITPLLTFNTPLNVLMVITAVMQGLTIASYVCQNNDDTPKGNDKQKEETKNNQRDELKLEHKKETKEKLLEIEDRKIDNQVVELQELKSVKEYLLSQKEQPSILTQERIKMIQKRYEPKKAVGGAK